MVVVFLQQMKKLSHSPIVCPLCQEHEYVWNPYFSMYVLVMQVPNGCQFDHYSWQVKGWCHRPWLCKQHNKPQTYLVVAKLMEVC